jgi:GNAT superfamily N-acetyltransferase
MSKNTISFAQWGMQKQLANLWQICFHEQPRPTNFFFNNSFQPQNCLLYKVGEETAAMVHLLPAEILQNGQNVQAHYIYAAATLPKYRGKGYMASLLKCAAYVGEKRGDQYSVLLPANRRLYEYYGKFGYVPSFETRFLTLPLREMQKAASYGQKNKVFLSYRQMKEARNEQICSQNGSVLWDEKAIAYADGINRLYSGRLICSQTGKKFAYALCRMMDRCQCEIVEIMVDDSTFVDLAANIVAAMPAQAYKLRLPNNPKLLGGQGKISLFGMIKPLSSITCKQIKSFSAPYLGLTLD